MTIYRVSGVLQTNEDYLRLLTAVDHAGLELCFTALHNTENGIGLPSEPDKLYKLLLKYKGDFDAMKANNEMSESDYNILLPATKETFTQEFSFELFQKTLMYFYKKKDSDKDESKMTFLKNMKELNDMYADNTLVSRLRKPNMSELLADKWVELFSILNKLNYDCSKLEVLRTIDLDDNKKFRLALLRSEIRVLLHECNDCMATLQTNRMALDRLRGNFDVALSQSNENNNNDNEKTEADLKDLNKLKEEILNKEKNLSIVIAQLEALQPDIKFWRQKNIEGDVIVCDEKISLMRNKVNEQTLRVGDLFNTVSFDICRIKERSASVSGDLRVISPTHTTTERVQ